jgi:two-component system NtrC family response regulator
MRRGLSDVSAVADNSAPFDRIICQSPSMTGVLRDVDKIAPIEVGVLLLGESGTGKELLARAIHDRSSRASGPFVAINCPAIPETLLESELFGHEKGSFTGATQQTLGKIERANGGTLFLDEIGDMLPSMQVKLLRFLQSQIIERVGGRPRQVDVRIVCATNQDLERQSSEGRFREDLFYRINQVVVRVPPVRERGGDAVLLAYYFLNSFADTYHRRSDVCGFSPDALRAIASYSWPGNVRDIENRVRRAVIMAHGSAITAVDLGLAETQLPESPINLRQARERAEVEVLRQALSQTGSNLSQAARLLGISRPTLYGLLRQHGLLRQKLPNREEDRPKWHNLTAAEI